MSQDKQIYPESHSHSRAAKLWAATIFFGFLASAVFHPKNHGDLYYIYEHDEFMEIESKESLNWSMTLLFMYFLTKIMSSISDFFILAMMFILLIFVVLHIVFCVRGILTVLKGEHYRVPFAIRIIQ